jgi:hypothetical protein
LKQKFAEVVAWRTGAVRNGGRSAIGTRWQTGKDDDGSDGMYT